MTFYLFPRSLFCLCIFWKRGRWPIRYIEKEILIGGDKSDRPFGIEIRQRLSAERTGGIPLLHNPIPTTLAKIMYRTLVTPNIKFVTTKTDGTFKLTAFNYCITHIV